LRGKARRFDLSKYWVRVTNFISHKLDKTNTCVGQKGKNRVNNQAVKTGNKRQGGSDENERNAQNGSTENKYQKIILNWPKFSQVGISISRGANNFIGAIQSGAHGTDITAEKTADYRAKKQY